MGKYYYLFITRLYVPLFSSNKQYINQFAAESFAFLLRKLPIEKLKQHLLYILKYIDSKSNLFQSISFLIYETVKGVQHQFHSKTKNVLSILFSLLNLEEEQQINNFEESKNICFNFFIFFFKKIFQLFVNLLN